jgi:hypothetical protein
VHPSLVIINAKNEVPCVRENVFGAERSGGFIRLV